jgi:hypothetical protein
MQHRLKAPSGSARTEVIATESLHEFLLAMYQAVTPLHVDLAKGNLCGACSSTQNNTSSLGFMARPPSAEAEDDRSPTN